MKSHHILNPEDIRTTLAQFRGTKRYHLHKLGSQQKLFLTDGANYVRDALESYWLFDLILSWQTHERLQGEDFQVWKLKRFPDKWLATCTNGNDNLLCKQEIRFSNFPLEELELWLIASVVMLPSEY